MRHHKVLTRSIILSIIINVALAAPATVRERPEVRLDSNVPGGVTTASQKRWDPLDPGDSSVGLTGSDYVPPSQALSTGLRLPMASMPDLNLSPGGGDSLSPPPSPSPHPGQPGPSEDRSPGPPGFTEQAYASSSTGAHYVPPSPGPATGSRSQQGLKIGRAHV